MKHKAILIGVIIGIIVGFISPWIIQFRFINFICPQVGGTPQYYASCVGDFYLSLFGTKFWGGNWHLLGYIPLFMIAWGIVGGLIGLILEKISKKRN